MYNNYNVLYVMNNPNRYRIYAVIKSTHYVLVVSINTLNNIKE